MKRKVNDSATPIRKSPKVGNSSSDEEIEVKKACKFTSTEKNTITNGTTTTYGMFVGESLLIQGVYDFTVLKGAVRILGATIHANPKPHRVCALAAGAALPLLECIQVEDVDLVNETREGDDQVDELFDNYRAVVKIEKVQAGITDLGNICPPFKSLFKQETELLSTVSDSTPVFNPLPRWKQVSEKVKSFDNSVILVVGSKRSGKSTFCKYLTNFLLSETSNINYLELDPGQPEYSPLGSLALYDINEFSFSPSYAHESIPTTIKSHSINNTSPKDQPGLYLSYAKDLVSTYKNSQTSAPLVINTPGWAKGLGLDLTRDIHMEAKSTHVICLGNDSDEIFEALDDNNNQVQLYNIDNFVSPLESKVSSADMRLFKTLSYFHNHDFSRHLTEIAPLQVPFTSIVGIAMQQEEGVLLDDLAKCINATIVSIISIDDEMEVDLKQDDQNIPWIGNTSEVLIPGASQCIGYAIIQSIDTPNQSVRLLTPVKVETLVNKRIVLSRGRLNLPVWAMWDHTKRSNIAALPYLTTAEKQGAGSTVAKVRRVPRR